MAWKIDRDYITPSSDDTYAVGRGQGDLVGPTFPFRLLDDDGEVYYHGIADAAAATDDDEDGGLYVALKWGGYFAGCTDLQLRPSDALEHHMTSPDYLEARQIPAGGWVSIYG